MRVYMTFHDVSTLVG